MEYMKVYEREQMIREQGEAIGEAKGEAQVVGIIRKMRETMSEEEIAEITGMDQRKVEKITGLLEKYPRESNEEIAVRLLSD